MGVPAGHCHVPIYARVWGAWVQRKQTAFTVIEDDTDFVLLSFL